MGCRLSVSPVSGEGFLTQFKLQLTGCYDKDQPLRYKFIFYQQKLDHEREVLDPLLPLRNDLADFDGRNLVE